jgi:sugar lactone lactonase YvrE
VVWDHVGQRLLFVDIPHGRIFQVDTRDRSWRSYDIPGTVGAVHPTDDGESQVIADSDGIGLCRAGSFVRRLAAPLRGQPDVRMNDANVDPAGRYFAGSMAFDQRPGGACLYRLDLDGSLTTVLTDVTISNGIDWSGDGRLCYYVDTPTHRIDVFDYDVAAGTLSGRRCFVDTTGLPGAPDGLTIDADDAVWVAFWGGGRVCRFLPDGTLSMIVELPVTQVTSCCFGGAALDELYISTSTEGLTPSERAAQPLAGRIFRVSPGITGRPQRAFRIPADEERSK